MRKATVRSFLTVLIFVGFLSGCAILQGKSSPSQYTNDAAITTQIKAKLAQSDLVSSPNVHVETQNGIVQISGFVSNQSQVAEAQRIVNSVSGVKSVINDLVVTPPPSYKKAKR